MSETTLSPKSRIKCRDIMSRKLTSVGAGQSLSEVAKILKEHDIGIVPVVDSEMRLEGLLTDRDIVVRAVAEGNDINQATAGDIMTREVFAAGPDDFVFEAVRTMGDKQVRRIPIVDGEGILVGIISMADVALEMEDEKEIAETLEEISSGEGFWNKK
ncbi:MAG: CBS domain-containing protein [Pyrinomonadaceae bacterium]